VIEDVDYGVLFSQVEEGLILYVFGLYAEGGQGPKDAIAAGLVAVLVDGVRLVCVTPGPLAVLGMLGGELVEAGEELGLLGLEAVEDELQSLGVEGDATDGGTKEIG
jgi:hypothetical protein